MFGVSKKESDPTNFRTKFITQYSTKEFLTSPKKKVIIPGAPEYFDKPIEFYCEDYFQESYDELYCLTKLLAQTVKVDKKTQKDLKSIKISDDPVVEDKKEALDRAHQKFKLNIALIIHAQARKITYL